MRTFIIFLSFSVMALSLTQYGLVSAESGTSDDDGDTVSLKDSWEKIKNYFKDLGLEIKERFAKFGEWVKENTDKAIKHAKTHLDKLKAIAKEYKEHIKELHKDVREEGLEFLRQYKEDLGHIWEDVKQAFKDAGGDLKDID